MHFISVVLLFTNICLVFTVSSFTKGEQMIPVLNECGTHCAVFGNHDFGKNVTRSFASLFCCCTVFCVHVHVQYFF